MKNSRNKQGYAILVVMAFALILASLLAASYNYSTTEIRVAARQGDIEDASVSYTHLTLPTNREV